MDATALNLAIHNLADWVMEYALALAAVGALSMALLEAAKAILESRKRHQARVLLRWSPCPQAGGDALAQLLALCSGVSVQTAVDAVAQMRKAPWSIAMPALRNRQEYAPIALKPEELAAVIQESIDIALGNHKQYPELFAAVTAGAADEDLKLWKARGSSGSSLSADAARELASAYGRIRAASQRVVDALQFRMEDQWARTNQLHANVLGALLMFTALSLQAGLGENLPATILVSLFGGILAPVAKDLVAALKKLRTSAS